MTDLPARLRKLIDEARSADETAAAGDSTLYSLMMKHINFLEGVAFERSRLRPLLEALVECVEDLIEFERHDIHKCGSLTALGTALKGMEE